MHVYSEMLPENPLSLFSLAFPLSAPHSTSLNSLRKGQLGLKKWNPWGPLLTYKTGWNVVKKVNPVNQLASQQIWHRQKLEEEKEYSTLAWHESWRLLPFISYEDHETSPSVVETERISNANWQCWDHFTWPLSSKGDQIYFFVLLGGEFLYFLRIIVNSWILKIFMIWLVTFFSGCSNKTFFVPWEPLEIGSCIYIQKREPIISESQWIFTNWTFPYNQHPDQDTEHPRNIHVPLVFLTPLFGSTGYFKLLLFISQSSLRISYYKELWFLLVENGI